MWEKARLIFLAVLDRGVAVAMKDTSSGMRASSSLDMVILQDNLMAAMVQRFGDIEDRLADLESAVWPDDAAEEEPEDEDWSDSDEVSPSKKQKPNPSPAE